MTERPTYEELEKRIKELEQAESERERIEEDLRESQTRFQLLLERASLGYQSLDEDGNFIEVNSAWLDIFGYSLEEVIGKSFSEFLHPDWKDHFREYFPRFKAVGEILGVEFEMVKKDGSSILVSFNGKIGKDKYGGFQQTHCIVQNITEHRRLEETLQEIAEKYSSLFHRSNDAIFIHDLDGNIIDANKKVLELFGYSTSEILSIKLPMLHPAEALEKSKRAFETIIREGFVRFETEFKKKNGEVFPAEVSSSFFKIGGKKVIQGIARDITERKQAEEVLRLEKERLQDALKEIKKLSGMLPICASCKKIRDDKGYWNQIESYISDHSEAEFSHGMCPECSDKLYGNKDWYIKMKKKKSEE